MVELEPGHVTLLDTERCERFEAVGLDSERCRALEHPLPERDAAIRRNIQLIGQLTRETQPQKSQPHPVDLDLPNTHVRQSCIGDIEPRERELEGGTRPRPGERHAGKVVGDRDHLHAQIRPCGLQQEFEPAHHLGRPDRWWSS